MTAVSAEMPLRVLADLLGMPRSDRHLIFEWSNALLGFDNPDADSHVEQAIGAFAELLAYGQAMADARRAEPLDDMVSRIVHAEVDGERLDDTEFGMFWLLLVVAGNETTRNALSGAVVALHEHDRWAWLRAHPDRLPTAVEELLRYVSPVMQFRRTATAATVLGDQQHPGGRQGGRLVRGGQPGPRRLRRPPRARPRPRSQPAHRVRRGPALLPGRPPGPARAHRDARPPARPGTRPGGQRPGHRVASNFINGISHLPVRLTPAA